MVLFAVSMQCGEKQTAVLFCAICAFSPRGCTALQCIASLKKNGCAMIYLCFGMQLGSYKIEINK